MRRPRNRTLAYVSLAAAAVLALATGVVLSSDDEPARVITLPPASSVLPGVALQAQEDMSNLTALLQEHGSGYDCPVNDSAKKIDDLTLCPDYTATLSFNELGTPAIVTPVAMFGVEPITMTAERVESCPDTKSSDFTGNTTCNVMYRVKWTVNPKYVALGNNTHYTWPDGTDTWTGAYGPDFYTGDQLISADDTLDLEIYASDPLSNYEGEPLSPAQMAKS